MSSTSFERRFFLGRAVGLAGLLGALATTTGRTQALVEVSISPAGASNFEYVQITNVSGNLIGDTQFGLLLSGFGANGLDSDDADAGSGGFSGSILVADNAAFFDLSANQTDLVVAGTSVQLIGGNGGNQTNDKSSNNAGAGGAAGDLTATNDGNVALQGIYGAGGTILEYQSLGGAGGSVASTGTNSAGQPEFNGGKGGQGGNGGNITVTNSSDLTPIGGVGLGNELGIHAISRGGDSGAGQTGGIGGSSGQIIVNQSGTLGINWTSQIPSGSAPGQIYGILAESFGGKGSSSYLKSTNGSNGGSSGGFFVTVGAGSNLTVMGSGNIGGAVVGGISRGGLGGDSYEGEEGADSFGGTGGFAGAGSFSTIDGGVSSMPSGSVVVVTDAVVTAVGDSISGLSAVHEGGNGGSGANEQQHSNGGTGGSTAEINVVVETATATTSISANGSDAAAIFVRN